MSFLKSLALTVLGASQTSGGSELSGTDCPFVEAEHLSRPSEGHKAYVSPELCYLTWIICTRKRDTWVGLMRPAEFSYVKKSRGGLYLCMMCQVSGWSVLPRENAMEGCVTEELTLGHVKWFAQWQHLCASVAQNTFATLRTGSFTWIYTLFGVLWSPDPHSVKFWWKLAPKNQM